MCRYSKRPCHLIPQKNTLRLFKANDSLQPINEWLQSLLIKIFHRRKSFNDALRYSATLPRLHFHVFEVQKPKVLLLLSTLRRDIEMKIPQGKKFTLGKKLSQSVSFLLRRQKRFIYSNLESFSSSSEVVSNFNSFLLNLTKIFFTRVPKKFYFWRANVI